MLRSLPCESVIGHGIKLNQSVNELKVFSEMLHLHNMAANDGVSQK